MKLTDKERKLLMLAMDKGVADGELEAAATALVRLLRARYPSGHELIKDLETLETRYATRFVQNPAGNYRMPFGKFKGERLKDVDTDYLEWVLQNCDNIRDSLRDAIEQWLND
jgi:putative quorum-sensing-regulated virulence factor